MNMFLQQPPTPSTSTAAPSAPMPAPMFGLTPPANGSLPATAPALPPQAPSPVQPILQPPVPVSPPVGLPPTFDPFAQMASPPPQHQGPGAVVGPPTNLPQMAPPIPQQAPVPAFLGAPQVIDPDSSKTEADLVGEYIALRDRKAQMNKELKESLEPIDTRMDDIERKMLGRLTSGGVDSLKTSAGGAYKQLKTYFNVDDPEQLFSWVEQSGNQQVLKRDIRQSDVREFMDTNGYVPPGIKVTSEFVVQFRK